MRITHFNKASANRQRSKQINMASRKISANVRALYDLSVGLNFHCSLEYPSFMLQTGSIWACLIKAVVLVQTVTRGCTVETLFALPANSKPSTKISFFSYRVEAKMATLHAFISLPKSASIVWMRQSVSLDMRRLLKCMKRDSRASWKSTCSSG